MWSLTNLAAFIVGAVVAAVATPWLVRRARTMERRGGKIIERIVLGFVAIVTTTVATTFAP